MAGRSVVLANEEFYHIFNRGIARQPTFFSKRDYERFILSLTYYRFKNAPVKLSRFISLSRIEKTDILQNLENKPRTIIEIISYSLMPNHFHLLLKQTYDQGITKYMSKVTNSYTKYINTKQERIGDLFQGVFKAIRIETDEQLVHVSRYIHLNPVVSRIIPVEDIFQYPWSSLNQYCEKNVSFISRTPVLSHFKSLESYKRFILDQVDYGKSLEDIKHLIFDQ